NSLSNVGVPQPLAPDVVLPIQGATVPPEVQPPLGVVVPDPPEPLVLPPPLELLPPPDDVLPPLDDELPLLLLPLIFGGVLGLLLVDGALPPQYILPNHITLPLIEELLVQEDILPLKVPLVVSTVVVKVAALTVSTITVPITANISTNIPVVIW